MPVDAARLNEALAGRYAVEREAGHGGMAIVFLARDLQHQRSVALKVLRPEIASSVGSERFHQEIKIASGLTHPHILPVFDSGEADGLLYYVMPFIEGESLAQRLEREGQLPVDEALGIAIEVADGLSYAHEHGVVHRDVKPGNILLSSGHAMISDFGIARALGLLDGDRLTRSGVAVGSVLYMSPEQASADERVDGRSDVYAVGCVLYEMLAGEPPFTGRTPQAIMARRLTDTPTSLRALRDTVPLQVDRIIATALHKTPADRFASAREFGRALRDAARGSIPDRQLARRGFDWSLMILLAAYVITSLLVIRLSLALAGRFDYLQRSGIGLAAAGLVLVAVTALVRSPLARSGRVTGIVNRLPRLASLLRKLRRYLTWQRSVAASLLALGLWGVVASAAMVARPTGTSSVGTSTAPESFAPTRIAVLYFDDISAEGDLGYFASGLTEMVIHQLMQVDRLNVISSNGVSGLRDAPLDSVARALSVGTVIDGSVTASGDRIRVTAQMFETEGMTQIASIQRESSGAEDWLEVVDAIVGDIAVAFRRRLGIEVQVRERAAGTDDERAWKLVQQAEQVHSEALPFMLEGDVASAEPRLRRADSLLAVAARLDPAWSTPVVERGWVAAGLADLMVPAVGYDSTWIDRGLELAEDALEREPSSPEALELRGFLRYQRWQATPDPGCDLVVAAEADLRRAVEADEARVRAWLTLADLLQYAKGNFEQARRAVQAAYEKDAFLSNAADILFTLAALSTDLEDHEQAIEWAERGRTRFPDDLRFPALELHAMTAGGTPDVARAWELVTATERLSSPRTRAITSTIVRGKMAAVLARAGLADSARSVLRRARAESPPEAIASLAQEEAHALLLLGDRQGALGALTRYLDANPDERTYAAVDPWWRDLRGDPGFEAIVERGPDASFACDGE